ncbi:Cytochrome P450 76A2 like [Actinidia chinensis var. chinensis]|uniref:Cytochrome P450 76A2 like n=1 Tax=Actinidia chinensis var. chinensis TaxID=1590841 RepID=A0A2R6RY12_ACTCC|nr:Cytochrome P450 76A2 like [Actinidia chinensis var. chinensis]
MESYWCLLTWCGFSISVALLLLLSWTKVRKSPTKQRPPGPAGWPVIGNMLDLGTMPHQNLYKLRFKYGPVLWLELGSVNTMVVQSAKAAEELFKNHDPTFCDRKCPDALTSWSYNQGSLAIGNYGQYWRILRRLCSAELLVSKRVNETVALRRKCIDNMTRWIEEDSMASRACGGSGEVEICRFLFLMAFNVVGNLMLSRDLLEPRSEEGREFYDAMNKIMEWAGKPNVADFLPFLKWLDPAGIKKNMDRDMGRAMKIASDFVKERIRQKGSGIEKVNKDFLDVVLEYKGDGKEGQDKISERNATIIVLEMFFAGSETTSSTIEWAMAELLRMPYSMRKVKDEIDQVVGPNRKVEEGDIDALPYLQAVTKETLRLHPVIPLLLPRNSLQDSNYMGYHIPKNTQVFVNAWAIGRDPESWDDPLSFKPERFLGKNIEYKGQHFELIPFGSGRRICVGFALAHRVVHLALATLLQSFDWELSNSDTLGTLDRDERMGITVRKLVPLKAIPKNRNFIKIK